MQNDKFKRLSDTEMKNVSGGKQFSVRHKGGLKSWEVVDENNYRYATCWTKSGAIEDRDTLQKLDIYHTVKQQELQQKFYKNLNEEPKWEIMEY